MTWLARAVAAIRTRPAFALLRILFGLCFVGGAIFLASSLGPVVPAGFGSVVQMLVVAASLLGYVAYVRTIEARHPVAELFSRGWLAELGAGLALGTAIFCLVIGVLFALGNYTVAKVNPVAVALPALTVSILAGVTEELLIRAVVFRLLEEWLGSWLALAFSALLFGVLHLGNANATWLSSAAIALEAGVLLGAAYMVTRRIWLAVGVHIAWNFTQSGIFGVATTGIPLAGILDGRLQGPAWLTGGAFGPEASVTAVVICVAAGVLILRRAIRKGHLVPPAWSRAPATMPAAPERAP